jgi:hypothetical protein
MDRDGITQSSKADTGGANKVTKPGLKARKSSDKEPKRYVAKRLLNVALGEYGARGNGATQNLSVAADGANESGRPGLGALKFEDSDIDDDRASPIGEFSSTSTSYEINDSGQMVQISHEEDGLRFRGGATQGSSAASGDARLELDANKFEGKKSKKSVIQRLRDGVSAMTSKVTDFCDKHPLLVGVGITLVVGAVATAVVYTKLYTKFDAHAAISSGKNLRKFHMMNKFDRMDGMDGVSLRLWDPRYSKPK